ncbi:hypothetical protein D0Z00_001711 [Geotrichum galactomycetum]|uniref:Uncharacterized protein n=1 Tax=Geotrichum galactomycetum TaxID=27317 RepID=A0ACB6V659_9ASCO|nr:hypothetical protein D0Z00_001711 [Geotrichum candidum]
MNKYLIIMGEFSTSLFSAIVGIIGSAKQLQALAKDEVLPFTKPFAKGTPITDDPINAVIFTYILAQITLLFDINQIATFITMAFLMTFVVTNLACFLLKIASAPNFRPSFKYFNSYTAGAGAAASVAAMFVADGLSASLMIVLLIVLFMVIHYISLPKPWGDVSQALIYHQVRKYLLRLRQDHVKFWRPQILLLVDDPRTAWNLIHFCNHLKKGGLYILGHVVVTQDFQQSFAEVKKQQAAWVKLRDFSKVKAFVQIAAGPDVVWGARNVYMGSGLGGMRPNITVLGFFEKQNHNNPLNSPKTKSADGCISIPIESLPTDQCRRETTINVMQWVNIIEDLLTMRANIAIAKGFPKLELPNLSGNKVKENSTRNYIDLYPIQMSAQIIDENGETSALTTNFDTYTLILQMGAILRTVPAWKVNHDLRVVVFVEFEEDVEEEKYRIRILLERLRINAEILVTCLSGGSIEAYETIVHGSPDKSGRVEKFLGKHEWWLELQDARKEWSNKYSSSNKPTGYIPQDRVESLMHNVDANGIGSVSVGAGGDSSAIKLKKSSTFFSSTLPPASSFLSNRKRRHTISSLQQMGISGLNIQTNKIRKSELQSATDFYRDSDSSDSESDSEAISTSASNPLSSSFVNKADAVPIHANDRKRVSLSAPRFSLPNDSALKTKPTQDSFKKSLDHSNQSDVVFTKKVVTGGTSVSPENSSLHKSLLSIPSVSKLDSAKLDPSATRPSISTVPSSASLRSASLLTSSAKKRKPNFSGLAMPNTRVDEADDGRPTIMFEKKRGNKVNSYGSMSDLKKIGGGSNSIAGARTVNERTPLISVDNNQTTSYSQRHSKASSIISEEPEVTKKAVSWNVDEAADDDEHEEHDEDPESQGAYLSFNHLPANAQHVILNDMMRTISKDSAVIFSTLPAPALGTHLSEEESWQYVESLDVWCQDLPPVILLHSQTMTVTTAL